MPRCTATTTRGRRCKNGALEGERVCQIHHRLRAEQDNPEGPPTAGGTDPGPALAPRGDGPGSPPPPPPEAASGAPEGASSAALEGLQEDDPTAAGGAEPREQRVEVDPELFRGLEDAGKPAEPPSPAPPPPPPRGALLKANPGPWSPPVLEGVILPPLNRRFSSDDVPELEGAEADVFLEALAASLNRVASRVDPNNPYAALVLSSSIMLGTRYVPRILRARKNGAPASVEAHHQEDAPGEPSADARAADGEASAASWADQWGAQL